VKAPDTIVIDGRAYSWRALCEQRRAQLEAWKAAHPQQPALFEIKHDSRPVPERTAAGRYREPTLLALLWDAAGGMSGEVNVFDSIKEMHVSMNESNDLHRSNNVILFARLRKGRLLSCGFISRQ
jgi:hypothetical protein